MRIIAGAYRGRKLKSVAGIKTRPTADRVKEAVFSAINERLRDCRFLDVFGGTGNIALEAISRGAAEAIIIENNDAAQKVIMANIQLCQAKAQCRLIKKDVLQALPMLATASAPFHIIYIDPPYQGGLYENVLQTIAEQRLLASGGIIIAESAKNTSLLSGNSIFCVYKEKCYGDTKISFIQYRKEKEEETS